MLFNHYYNFFKQILSTGDCWTGSQKQRHKREWVVPAKRFTENVDYSHLQYVGKVIDNTIQRFALLITCTAHYNSSFNNNIQLSYSVFLIYSLSKSVSLLKDKRVAQLSALSTNRVQTITTRI